MTTVLLFLFILVFTLLLCLLLHCCSLEAAAKPRRKEWLGRFALCSPDHPPWQKNPPWQKKSSLAKNSSLAREEEKSFEEVASWGNAIQLEEQRDRLRSWSDLRKSPKFWLIFSLNGPFVFLRVFAVFLCVFAVVVWLCRTRRWVCWMSD